ncbi:TonB-dependent siderophore receptor [Danxiaibacter flavus]|uniref:TonB-dependent siderophore receptor n=1 Tax=Danxiaibacter flavus TaxID=3049108 RepID=A0ABV3ZED4_9BACT|nr:TonB-dependent siderophore receptor [Chitinophagaceae bacterium DXS]
MNYSFRIRRLLSLPVLIVLTLNSFAFTGGEGDDEGNGSIRGKVSTTDNKPAAMVNVILKNSRKRVLTADDGSFTLRNIKPGEYQLEISLVGYETLEQSVLVEAGKSAQLNLQLKISEKELDEIVVKSGIKGYKSSNISPSLRLQEPLLDVSQNIQIVTGKALADQQVVSMSDGVIRNVSGATRLEHWADMYTNITMRGSQIQAFRNGFNFVNSYWGPLTEDMSYVDHIEFVKGPAGFMLANGDPSGLYDVVTKKPTGQTKGEIALTLGSFDMYRASLDLDGKLSKDSKVLYRLNVAAQNKNSFRQFEYNDRYSIAPVISYQIDDKTKLTAEYTWQHAKMSDVGSYYVFSTDGYATLPREFTTMPPGLAPTVIDDHSVFLNLQHQISSNWKFTAQAAYSKYKQQGSDLWPAAVNPDGTMLRSMSIWDAQSHMSLGQAFINGNVKTGKIQHRILGGIDVGTKAYMADWSQYHMLDTAGAEFNTKNPVYGVPVNGYPTFDRTLNLEARSVASGGNIDQSYTGLYAQDELGFFDNVLRLTLAGRYTFVKQDEWGGSRYSAKHFTPRIGLSVSVDKQTSVYGLYDQAFIPQSGKLADGGKVKPITGNNIEFGIKRDWSGGKWNTSVSVYRILKENELTTDPNSPPTSGLSIVMGQKRAQGVEFDLKGSIASGLNLIANYAYTDSRVTKVADGVTGMKVGDVVPGYAKHTANAWLSYQVQNGALKGIGVGGGATWMGDRATGTWSKTNPQFNLPNYFRLDGSIFWEKEKIRLSLNMQNMLDEYLYSGSYYDYLKAYYWQAEAPRNLRFNITYRF